MLLTFKFYIAELLSIRVLFCSLLQKQKEMNGAGLGDFQAGTVQRILHTAILGERPPNANAGVIKSGIRCSLAVWLQELLKDG